MRFERAALVGVALAMLASPAAAHVTVQPNEAVTGSFARFVVRVPTERDDAATTKVEVQLPESLVAVSFQPKPGWTRRVETRPRTAPVDVFGEQVTDYTASVTWEGGRIEPGEFDEFGFSARVPGEATTLEFPAVQTYSSGEVVRWIGPPDAEEPAARVRTFALGAGEEQPGQLEVLSRVASGEAHGAGDEGGTGGDGADGTAAIVLAGVGIVLGGAALLAALLRRRTP